MNGSEIRNNRRRILGRVSHSEFVGRNEELERIVAHANQTGDPLGLLILLAPAAGVSELMRQAFDAVFNLRGRAVPIFFSIPRSETTSVSTAIAFLNTFLTQYIAFKRDDPSICHSTLMLRDLLRLAPPSDYEWIEELLESYERGRFTNDDQALVRFCLSAPQRVPKQNGLPYVMIDMVGLAAINENDNWSMDQEIIATLERSRLPFALAGLRRHLLDAAHDSDCPFESFEVLRLDRLNNAEASQLIEFAARRQGVELNEQTRDLLVQQFDGNPLFISMLLQAAHEKGVALTTFLACEKLYVDELMGGHLHRHFSWLLEQSAPRPETRRALIRLLTDAVVSDQRKASFEAWRRPLRLEVHELDELLTTLHVHELINWSSSLVDAGTGPACWRDYLKIQFRLEVQSEPRALVVADAIADALKRAPHTMATHYRSAARFDLRSAMGLFNSQLVPRILFHYDRFKATYRGASLEEIVSGLDSETDLVRLPQVFHTTRSSALVRLGTQADEDSAVIAHAFEGATYSDANEIVWIADQIESKLEVTRELADLSLTRVEDLADEFGFARVHILLVSNEGFDDDAIALLEQRNAYGVSRQQMELLNARLAGPVPHPVVGANEFVAVWPMGGDNELLAANLVEQIARRYEFQPEAINQIKTAIVEACINAAEHSLSPDRKIYQRFHVEGDKLVISISSRGVVPTRQSLDQGRKPERDFEPADERRGWGLKLIKSLMDEVEFEHVDDGTSLRMTKYLRKGST
jgi:anti-sigma regulatory factor (Ser/Thr protein kinase)